MKFLNNIDGAKRIVQDSSNRFVTDGEKGIWNAKANGSHAHSDYVLLGDTIQNTNSFGGRQLYINTLDNILSSADKKYYVTITIHKKVVLSVSYPKAINIGDITQPQWEDSPVVVDYSSNANSLFNNDYESGITIPTDSYAKIKINFNASGTANFTGYPYGTYYLSYYYSQTPESAQARCYNSYVPHELGYKTLAFSDYIGTKTSTAYIQQCDDGGNYSRRELEFIIFADPIHTTQVTQIEWKLVRPNFAVNTPLITNYGVNKVYHPMYFGDQTTNKISILPTGTIEALSLVSTTPTGTAPLSVASTTVVPNLNASTVTGFTVGKAVPANALFTDTVYTHPTGAGSNHVPTAGTTGQFLKWSASGVAVWAADNDTIYTHPTNHAATMITEDTSHKFVTDTEKTAITHSNRAVLDKMDDAYGELTYDGMELGSKAMYKLTMPESYKNATSSLSIPSPEGNTESIHATVVYVPLGLNGYKYWMVNTPYVNTAEDVENPCVYKSNDGITWLQPSAGVNPLSPKPSASGSQGKWHNSDPTILHRTDINRLEIWWRRRWRDTADPLAPELILRRTSTDGTTWTAEEELFRFSPSTTGGNCLSPSAVYRYDLGIYEAFLIESNMVNEAYADKINKYTTNSLGKSWVLVGGADPKFINANAHNWRIWHGQVSKTTDKYELIVTCGYDTMGSDMRCFYGVSNDGITYTPLRQVLAPLSAAIDGVNIYHASMVKTEYEHIIYYTGYNTSSDWTLNRSVIDARQSALDSYSLLKVQSNNGAIVESGTNANGSYIRYDDGTQICHQKYSFLLAINITIGSMFKSAGVNWAYPMPFISAPTVTINMEANSANPWWIHMTTCFSSSVNYFASGLFTSAQFTNVHNRYAIGRWKAAS